MKLGLLTTSYPRDPDDVAGDFVRGFARTLARRGHLVDVLAPEPRTPPTGLHDPGITVHHVPYVRPRALARTFYGAGVPDNLQRDPLAYLGLVTLPPALLAATARRAHAWDAFVSHWALPSAVVAGAVGGVGRRGRPHLAVMHSADVHLLERLALRRTLARLIEAGATSLWFVSPELKQRFESCLGRPVALDTHVGPMGLDLPQAPAPWERERARAELGVAGAVLLVMARLVPIKGIDVALEALGRLPDVTLLIAGDGPERTKLEARAHALGVRTRFLGFVRGESKRRAFAAADAFVLPSIRLRDGRTEGAPVAVLEALAHGLPVIASDAGGTASLLDQSTGVLVPPADARALGDAVAALLHDEGRHARMRVAAIARARRYAWEPLGETMLRLLSPIPA